MTVKSTENNAVQIPLYNKDRKQEPGTGTGNREPGITYYLPFYCFLNIFIYKGNNKKEYI